MTPILRRLGVGGVIAAVWLVSFVVLLVTTPRGQTATGVGGVSGDGIYYFVQLESALADRDFDFANNLERFRANPHVAKQLDSGVTTPAGRTPNLFSVGPALLWAPVYAVVHWASVAAPAMSQLELWAPSIATSLYVLVGLLCAYGASRRLGMGKAVAAAAVCVWYVGSNLVYYATFEASMAHGLGFAVVSALLYVALRLLTRQNPLKASGKLWFSLFGLGLLAGLAGLVRWQLVLVAIPLVLYTLWTVVSTSTAQRVKALFAALAGFCLAVLPQLFTWKAVYGSYLLIPQGSGFIIPSSPHFFEVLISARHGLLTWTPLVVLTLVGLVWAAATKSRQAHVRIARLALVAIVLQVYVNGSLLEWWGGDAFGPRRFTDIGIFFVLGLALFVQWLMSARSKTSRYVGLMLVGLCVVFNLVLLQLYRTDRIPRGEAVYPRELVETLRR